MRNLLTILIFTISTRLFSQDFQLLTSGDTLTIKETSIATDPFGFGDNPLLYFQKFTSNKTYQTVKNTHVENQTDTIFTLRQGKDVFKIMKWGESQNGLIGADVLTTNFKTRHGLRIGLKKHEAVNILSKYGVKAIPGHLILEDMEVYELVTCKFTGDVLSKITFQGYID